MTGTVRIQFYTPPNHGDPFHEVREMPVVPSTGERIMFKFNGYLYLVKDVCWTPCEEDYDVYVSLR